MRVIICEISYICLDVFRFQRFNGRLTFFLRRSVFSHSHVAQANGCRHTKLPPAYIRLSSSLAETPYGRHAIPNTTAFLSPNKICEPFNEIFHVEILKISRLNS